MTRQIRGLQGSIHAVETAVPAAASLEAPGTAASAGSGDIDLRLMAEWALHYLIETPRQELGYEPVFQCSPLECPPIPQGTDVVVACDTDARMDWEWYYMRDIAGSDKGKDVEAAFHKRIRNYIADDGKVLAHVGCYNEGLVDAVYGEEDKVIHIWGATKILKSLAEEYTRTRDPDTSALAGRVMKALKQLAVWQDGHCYFPGGMGAINRDLTVVPNAWNKQPAPVVGSLVTYWLATGDPEGLECAIAYAEGMIRNLQPGGIVFQADGSVRSYGNVHYKTDYPHSHATMHAVWGVAHLGAVLGEARYFDFAKKIWDWMNARGTGTGWFPAMPDNCCETCLLSDMISIACLIGQNGHPEYYDYAERIMRNYIHNLQFIITPEFEKYYRELNKDSGEAEIAAGLEILRKFQGGIIGGSGLNDYENELLGGACGFKMFGCCAPEGMRAVHTIWSNTAEYRDNARVSAGARIAGGEADAGATGVYINMSFSRDFASCRVVSHLPEQGRLSVQVKQAGRFFLRLPHWVLTTEARAFVNGKEVAPVWNNGYVRFDAQAGDELTIAYPLIRFSQEVRGLWSQEADRPELVMQFQWLGNRVIAADPPSGKTALFSGQPRNLPVCSH